MVPANSCALAARGKVVGEREREILRTILRNCIGKDPQRDCVIYKIKEATFKRSTGSGQLLWNNLAGMILKDATSKT